MTSISSSSKGQKYRNNLMPDETNLKSDYVSKIKSNNNNNKLNTKILDDENIDYDLHNSKLIKEFIFELYNLKPNDEIIDKNPLEFSNSDPPEHIISYSYLKSIATIPIDWINEVKSKHKQVINLLNNEDIINDNNFNLKTSTNDGAVIIGGSDNDLTWLSLISIRVFRRAGGILPVEVMLPTINDYLKDKEICDIYLPQLNAKCIIMKDLIENSKIHEHNIRINSYIFNNFNLIKRELSILLSSFENVLYLSPENLMLKKMESSIFEKKFFKDFGLISWGDYEPRFTLPSFYEISDIKIKNIKSSNYGLPLNDELIKEENEKLKKFDNEKFNNEINYHDLLNSLPYKQSDASEILINKRQHLKTLLLSLYYNLNGPKIYYILLTGKFDGDHGSKETILAASHVLNNNYYLINTDVESNGYWYNNEYFGVSMLQFDPIVDYFSYEAFIEKFANKKEGLEITQSKFQKWLKESSERRSALFLNINNPPLKPIELIKDGIVIKDNGDRIKLISESSYFDPLFESDIWRIMNDYICHLSLNSNYPNTKLGKPNSKERKDFCNNDIKEHLLWISNLDDER